MKQHSPGQLYPALELDGVAKIFDHFTVTLAIDSPFIWQVVHHQDPFAIPQNGRHNLVSRFRALHLLRALMTYDPKFHRFHFGLRIAVVDLSFVPCYESCFKFLAIGTKLSQELLRGAYAVAFLVMA